MDTCLFSIVLPCYNSESYVASAIESVINQTYDSWELIIVNDGSTDNTLKIITEYALKDKRIRILSKKNGGYSTAVNFGLDEIKGDYFLFLGSDDSLCADLFEKLIEQIKLLNSLPDMIAFRTRLVQNGVIGKIDRYTNFNSTVYCEYGIKTFYENDSANSAIFTIRDTSRCYKTSLLEDTRYFGSTGMDADGIFSMLLARKASSFLVVPVDGYLWTLRNDSVSATPSLNKKYDRINNWHKFFELVLNQSTNTIADYEKQYFTSASHLIVELSLDRTIAKKSKKLIKNEAKFYLRLAKKHGLEVHKLLRYSSKMPVLLATLYELYSKNS